MLVGLKKTILLTFLTSPNLQSIHTRYKKAMGGRVALSK